MRRMSDTTADLPALPPSTANEDIRRALADVDARLSALAAAVAGAKTVTPKGVDAEPKSSPSPPPAKPEVVKAKPAVAKAPSKPAAPPVPKVDQAPVEPVAVPEPEPKPEPEPATVSPAANRVSQDEDEALLASLDPETAQAIKVMRRMSFENKSVRQLLEEYEATRQSQGSSEGRKKSWWSRG